MMLMSRCCFQKYVCRQQFLTMVYVVMVALLELHYMHRFSSTHIGHTAYICMYFLLKNNLKASSNVKQVVKVLLDKKYVLRMVCETKHKMDHTILSTPSLQPATHFLSGEEGHAEVNVLQQQSSISLPYILSTSEH